MNELASLIANYRKENNTSVIKIGICVGWRRNRDGDPNLFQFSNDIFTPREYLYKIKHTHDFLSNKVGLRKSYRILIREIVEYRTNNYERPSTNRRPVFITIHRRKLKKIWGLNYNEISLLINSNQKRKSECDVL